MFFEESVWPCKSPQTHGDPEVDLVVGDEVEEGGEHGAQQGPVEGVDAAVHHGAGVEAQQVVCQGGNEPWMIWIHHSLISKQQVHLPEHIQSLPWCGQWRWRPGSEVHRRGCSQILSKPFSFIIQCMLNNYVGMDHSMLPDGVIGS